MRFNSLLTTGVAATTLAASAMLLAQTPAGGNARQGSRPFQIFTVEGQPIDKRPPELDTDHPVFPGQTHAPYHKTVDVSVATIATNLDSPWAVELLPSGRFLITEKPGRIRILNSDGSPFRTITERLPAIYVRGQSGLLDVALDQQLSNHSQDLLHLFARRRRGQLRRSPWAAPCSTKTPARSRM